MTYSIFHSTGNLVDAFDDRDAAVAALRAIVQTEPEAAEDVLLVIQDDARQHRWRDLLRLVAARRRVASGRPAGLERDGSLVEPSDVD